MLMRYGLSNWLVLLWSHTSRVKAGLLRNPGHFIGPSFYLTIPRPLAYHIMNTPSTVLPQWSIKKGWKSSEFIFVRATQEIMPISFIKRHKIFARFRLFKISHITCHANIIIGSIYNHRSNFPSSLLHWNNSLSMVMALSNIPMLPLHFWAA